MFTFRLFVSLSLPVRWSEAKPILLYEIRTTNQLCCWLFCVVHKNVFIDLIWFWTFNLCHINYYYYSSLFIHESKNLYHLYYLYSSKCSGDWKENVWSKELHIAIVIIIILSEWPFFANAGNYVYTYACWYRIPYSIQYQLATNVKRKQIADWQFVICNVYAGIGCNWLKLHTFFEHYFIDLS